MSDCMRKHLGIRVYELYELHEQLHVQAPRYSSVYELYELRELHELHETCLVPYEGITIVSMGGLSLWWCIKKNKYSERNVALLFISHK